MRRILLATTALATVALSIQAASAADMRAPVYKAAPAPYVSGWSGCYVGGNAGYAWTTNQSTFDEVVPAPAGGATLSGGAVGAQVGCDYQQGPMVLGIQGMFDWSGMEGSHLYAGTPTETIGIKNRWFATLTGRLGYAGLSPQALLYVKGGAAWARFDYTDDDPTGVPPYGGRGDAVHTGYTVGVGAEYKFLPNVSAFVEYNYIGLGAKSVALTYPAGVTFANPYTYTFRNDFHTVLVGLNYRFGGR